MVILSYMYGIDSNSKLDTKSAYGILKTSQYLFNLCVMSCVHSTNVSVLTLQTGQIDGLAQDCDNSIANIITMFICIYVYLFIYLFIESPGLATFWGLMLFVLQCTDYK